MYIFVYSEGFCQLHLIVTWELIIVPCLFGCQFCAVGVIDDGALQHGQRERFQLSRCGNSSVWPFLILVSVTVPQLSQCDNSFAHTVWQFLSLVSVTVPQLGQCDSSSAWSVWQFLSLATVTVPQLGHCNHSSAWPVWPFLSSSMTVLQLSPCDSSSAWPVWPFLRVGLFHVNHPSVHLLIVI